MRGACYRAAATVAAPRSHWRGSGLLALLAAVWAVALAVGASHAQVAEAPRPLSLEEALARAEAESEAVAIARAGVLRSRGEQVRARAEWFPQVGASLSYTKTLASEFEGAFGGGESDSTSGPPPEPCEPFEPDPSLPLEQRVGQLEQAVSCDRSPFAGFDFSELPFGRENAYRLGLSVSQNLFTGGRLLAQRRIASSAREVAELALESARAEVALEVTQAYYDALLADRLHEIARATLEQSEQTLRHATLARQVGNAPEFEVLRAQVTVGTQRPVVIQRASERELAHLRLRQVLNLPADVELELTSELDERVPERIREIARANGAPTEAGDRAALRAVVRQAREAVEMQAAALSVARAQRLPLLSLSSQYGRIAYPTTGLPSWDEGRDNWTVALTLSVPLFTGGRIRGDELVARANLLEAESRLRQVGEIAALDTRGAYERLATALAAWEASEGTVEQARRAYGIAEIRYAEGISTQVELSDARILLEQAQANRAVAARDLLVAQRRVELLPYLPISGGGVAGAGTSFQGGR